MDKLEERKDEERFFLWMHYFNTRIPYDPKLEYVEMFRRNDKGPQSRPAYDYTLEEPVDGETLDPLRSLG